jgi:UDP-N-acetylglucosamine 1-carboxyvinyltransferase
MPTDLQSQWMAWMALASGSSTLGDRVFSDRFLHVAELKRLGAQIERAGERAVVSGVERLSGACVMASDLRASAALVLAGLAAQGQTIVRRIYHLDRGYERLERKLRSLGGRIERLSEANLQPSLPSLPDLMPSGRRI